MSEKNNEKDVHSYVIDNRDEVREPEIKDKDKAGEENKKEDTDSDKEKDNTVKNEEQIKDNPISNNEKKDEQQTSEKKEIDDIEIPKTDMHFIDVPKTHWAYKEISDLANNSIIFGYGNGYFGVDDSVTYEQVALLLERQFDYIQENNECIAAKREDVIVSLVKAMNVNVADAKTEIINKNFNDCNTVSHGNEKYIAYAIETNLVVGYNGKLNLNKNITRAETACLIQRAINIIK